VGVNPRWETASRTKRQFSRAVKIQSLDFNNAQPPINGSFSKVALIYVLAHSRQAELLDTVILFQRSNNALSLGKNDDILIGHN
jgi:hypothetical protein